MIKLPMGITSDFIINLNRTGQITCFKATSDTGLKRLMRFPAQGLLCFMLTFFLGDNILKKWILKASCKLKIKKNLT